MQRAEERAAAFSTTRSRLFNSGVRDESLFPDAIFLEIPPHLDAIFLLNYLLIPTPSLSYICYGYPTNASDEGKRASGEEHVAEEWEDGDIPAHHCHSRTNTKDYTDL